MKTIKLVFVLLFALILNTNVSAQQKKPAQKQYQKVSPKPSVPLMKDITKKDDQTITVRPVRTTGTTTTVRTKEKICKPMDIRRTEDILRDRVGRSLNVLLDKDYGFIEILGKKQNVNFKEYRVQSVVHGWVYTLNDIRSNITRVQYKDNKYIMTIEFENKGLRVEAVGPSCKVRKDSRAPDINWKNPALQIVMTPVAYNNSFTFEVNKVEMKGKFEVNGAMDVFLPSITRFFKNNMENTFKSEMQRTFNSDQVKRMLADVFKPEVQLLGLGEVKSVDMSRGSIYLCNY